MGLRTRRANLWAGVYAGLFKADAESTDDVETADAGAESDDDAGQTAVPSSTD